MTSRVLARSVLLLVFLIAAFGLLGAAFTGTTTVSAASYTYNGPTIARVDVHHVRGFGAAETQLRAAKEACASPSLGARGTSTTSFGSFVATEAAAPRFVVNSAGEALDTARITIPGGKYGYLLENPAKSGVFADSMGFDHASLDTALRSHLVDNFGTATPSVPMVGGGTKFSVTGPMVGPSGAKWTITTAWGVDPDGTIRLITATP